MPDIKFYCPSCGKKMGIDAKAAGLLVNCPDCKKEIKVPHESESAPPPSIHRPVPPAPPFVVPSAAKPLASTPRPLATRPIVTPRVPPPTSSPALPVESKPVDDRLVHELKEAKAALDRQAESFRTLADEHDALKKRLLAAESGSGSTRDELDRLRSATTSASKEMESKLADALRENARWQAEKNAAQAQVEELRKELQAVQAKTAQESQGSEALTAKIHELEKNLKVTSSAASHATSARDAAEQKNKALERQVEELKQKQTGIDEEREGLQRDLKECEDRHKSAMEKMAALMKQHESLILAQENLKSEVGDLKAERTGLLKHQQEAASLNRALADMQKQMEEMRDQEKELIPTIKAKEELKPEKLPPPAAPEAVPPVPVAPEPARTEPWVYSDPFLKMKRWMYVYASIAVCSVVGSIIFVMLWPQFAGEKSPVPSRWTASESTGNSAGKAAVIGTPVSVDDVDVTFERVRVGPVKLISMLGAETMSDQPYLVIDIQLTNRSEDREVVVMQAWRDAKLLDNRGRRLKPAFHGPVLLETVEGVIVDRTLKPGESASDQMVFEWESSDAESFALTVDPGFRKITGNQTTSQISLTAISMTFGLDEVVVE